MPERWSRRALLASVGAAALAGCTDPSDDATDETPTAGPQLPAGTPDTPDSIGTAWPVPGATPAGGNYTAAAAGPTDPVAPLWMTDLGAAATAPVVADGRLFVAGAETLSALDARTGERQWSEPVPASPATPRVVDDSVYVPTADGLVALAAADGTERWRRDIPGLTAALAADHGVYALAEDGAPTVVAFDRADGSERWRTALTRGPSTAHLFASDESVFVSSGGNGSTPWRLAVDTGDVVGQRPGISTDSPDPRFYRDGTVFSTDNLPSAVDARPAPGRDSGHEWTDQIWDTNVTALSAGPDAVYSIGRGDYSPEGNKPRDGPGLYALGLTDGSRMWSTSDIDTESAGRPAVAADAVLVPTADVLHCFDPVDGAKRWAVPTDGLGRAPLAVVDDIVYATADETVRAYRPP